MKITLEKLNLIDNNEKLKGFASVIIDDCFKVTGIRIIEGENGLFLSMPSTTMKDGSRRNIVHPIDSDTRNLFNDVILSEYKKQIK